MIDFLMDVELHFEHQHLQVFQMCFDRMHSRLSLLAQARHDQGKKPLATPPPEAHSGISQTVTRADYLGGMGRATSTNRV